VAAWRLHYCDTTEYLEGAMTESLSASTADHAVTFFLAEHTIKFRKCAAALVSHHDKMSVPGKAELAHDLLQFLQGHHAASALSIVQAQPSRSDLCHAVAWSQR